MDSPEEIPPVAPPVTLAVTVHVDIASILAVFFVPPVILAICLAIIPLL